MRHGSLFTGIGGFDLAAQWMGWQNIFQVEWDSYCQRVLTKNFPTTKRYEDIKEFNGGGYCGFIDIISGGFPCQPFSITGQKKGAEDDRDLWPEMFRVIREIQPPWVVCENVANLTRFMEFGRTLSDLESQGYKVQTFNIPAISQNAPHERQRIWIIAYANGFRRKTNDRLQNTGSDKSLYYPSEWKLSGTMGLYEQYASYTKDVRVYDGLPGKMDADRVKALGNAIVPQVAYQIFKAIEQYSDYINTH